MITTIAAFNAQMYLNYEMSGKDMLDLNGEVYNILSSYPKKKQDIVMELKTVLKNEGYEVTYEVAEQIATKALNNLKKKNKAENPTYGMWKKI